MLLCTLIFFWTQNFWDPATGLEFHYNRADASWNSSWWYGEPVSLYAPSDRRAY